MTASECLKRIQALSLAELWAKSWWRLLKTARRLRFYRRFHRPGVYSAQEMIDPSLQACRTGEELRQHLCGRTRPRFFFDASDRVRIVSQVQATALAEMAAVVSEAKRILENRIYIHGFGEVYFENRIVWFDSPHPYRDKLLSRHDFIPTLIQAYWYTSDRRFAESAIALWRDWISQSGRLKLDNSIDNSIRIQNWLWLLYGLRTEDLLNRTDIVELLSEVYRSAFYIEADMMYAANHRVIEALGLWCTGVFFPELRYASERRAKGESILLQEIEQQVFTDGVHKEMSSGYHVFVSTHFLKFYILSRANGYAVPEQFRARLAKMLAVVEALRKPDGELPMLGDSDALRSRDREHLESALLLPALSWFRNGEIPAVASSDREGLVPWYLGSLTEERGEIALHEDRLNSNGNVTQSQVLPEAGYVLMRAGCGSKGHFMLMDVGPFGMDALSHHGHADALHVEICASGESLVIDPGGYRYVDDCWRQFFRSTRAHSTVVVDGRSQSEIFGMFGVGRTARCRVGTCLTNERIDFVVACHDGYQRLPSPVIHQRAVLFVKQSPSYWIIIDRLEGQGDHTLDLLFHLIPKARLHTGQGGEIVVEQTQGELTEIRSLLSPPDVPTVIEGQVEPEVQGWVARTTGVREKAPVLSFKKQTSLPQMFATLIRPEASTITDFEVKHIASSDSDHGLRFACELRWANMGDKVSILYAPKSDSGSSWPNATIERSEGGQSVWRQVANYRGSEGQREKNVEQ